MAAERYSGKGVYNGENMRTPSQTGSQSRSAGEKSWLVLTSSETDFPQFLRGDTQAMHIINDNYKVLNCKPGTTEYQRLSRVWTGLSACKFAIVDAGGIYHHPAFHDEKKCLQFLSAPQEFGVFDSRTTLFRFLENDGFDSANEFGTCASNIWQDCDERCRIVAPTSCALSIRLIDGSSVRAFFNSKESLMDVKRWLQSELGLSLVPDENTTLSRYTRIGHFEPSRFAFFHPATRKTFSEAQEYLKVEDLGLCPRSALILRPDYDESMMNAARSAEGSSFFKVMSNLTHFLQALYSFFDYGVDDASRECEDKERSSEPNCLSPPQFLGTAGSVPSSTSLIDVSQFDTSTRDQDAKNVSRLQASSENFIRVGREEF